MPKPTMSFLEKDILYLRDILKYAKEATSFTTSKTLIEIEKDSLTCLALERAIEIIGEAAKNISNESKQKLPNMPWRDMTRTRDLLAHHYFKIDIKILWKIVKDDLPALIDELEVYLG